MKTQNHPYGMFPEQETTETPVTYPTAKGASDKACFQCCRSCRKWGTTPGGAA